MADHNASMDLLVFREKDGKFGLDATQIEEILRPQELKLHRRSSGDIYSVYREGIEIPAVGMAAVIGMEEPASYENAKFVVPKAVESGVGFLIGEPEEIIQVKVEEIELLPPLIRPMVRGSGMWGIVRSKGKFVIIIDLLEAAEGIVTATM